MDNRCGPSVRFYRQTRLPLVTDSTLAVAPELAVAPRFVASRRSRLAERRVLIAAGLGWMFDSMDFLIYVLAIGRLKSYFGFGDATAGLLGTLTLVSAAVGGLSFGVIADRIGRVRALNITILIYSICSLGAATSQSVVQLAIWRALLGIGMGGEWASGAVLVAESLRPELRNKATSAMQSTWALGAILAAVLAGLVLDVLPFGDQGWRVLFALGGLPALFTLWAQRNVEEPAIWRASRASPHASTNPYRVLFGPELRKRTLLACLLASLLQFAYWGLFFWLPNLLASPIEKGGAGMSVVKSTGWLIPIQVGAFIGYLSFGPLADRFGRRRVFATFVCASAILVPVYGRLVHHPTLLLAAQSRARLRGPRLLERRRAAHVRAVSDRGARQRPGARLQLGQTRSARPVAVRDRRPRRDPARRHRVGAEPHVGVLPRGRRRRIRVAGSESGRAELACHRGAFIGLANC